MLAAGGELSSGLALDRCRQAGECGMLFFIEKRFKSFLWRGIQKDFLGDGSGLHAVRSLGSIGGLSRARC